MRQMVSTAFSDWRFNLRRSNTEPLVRLNVESHGSATKIQDKVADIARLLGGTKVWGLKPKSQACDMKFLIKINKLKHILLKFLL